MFVYITNLNCQLACPLVDGGAAQRAAFRLEIAQQWRHHLHMPHDASTGMKCFPSEVREQYMYSSRSTDPAPG